jgi:hypothetical protein
MDTVPATDRGSGEQNSALNLVWDGGDLRNLFPMFVSKKKEPAFIANSFCKEGDFYGIRNNKYV